MKALCTCIALTIFAGVPAFADKTIAGHTYPDSVDVPGHKLKLVGVGLREKWWFDIYTMGVYMKKPRKSSSYMINSNQPKFLWLRMKRTISAEKMRDAVDEGVEKNVSKGQRAKLTDRLQTFKQVFPSSIRKGLHLGFTYVPGVGTTVMVGGQKKATIDGKDFASALWSIWFGRKPADSDLKKQVLKND